MLVKGDKLVATKDVTYFLKKGDIIEVIDVDDSGMIAFAFGEELMHMGVMNQGEYESYFKKYVEPNKAQLEKIDELLNGLENFKQNLLKLKEELQNDCDGDCPCYDCCGDCDECDFDEFDECLDTDLDCDDCEDYDCPYNSNVYNK